MSEQMPFHSTPIGRKYYEETLPNLIKSLNKLAGALEKRGTAEVSVNDKETAKADTISVLLKTSPYRFPLFTGWIFYLLNYKMAYEFVKKKGLFKEFQMWSEDEGRQLVKTFFKEGLQMIEEQEQRDREATNITEEATKRVKRISMEQNLVETIKEEEKKKKDDELGRITRELSRVDVEIADLAQKLAVKKKIRVILETKSRILAREISEN